MKSTLLVFCTSIIPSLLFAQAGALDITFNNIGYIITDFQGASEYSFGMTQQGNGKVLVTGEYKDTAAEKSSTAIVRYNTDGSLDSTFGDNGMVLKDFGESYSMGRAVAIQQDQKILIAGTTSDGDYNEDIFLLRLHSDGTPDSSFSYDGKTQVDIEDDFAESIALQIDGKILVAGYKAFASNRYIIVLRFQSTGVLDSTFGDNGIFTLYPSQNDWDDANDIKVQPDGKIVVCGFANPYAVVFRLLENGTLDNTFSNNGVFNKQVINNESAYCNALWLSDSGDILAAGYTRLHDGSRDGILFRLNSDGLTDTTFGDDGLLISNSIDHNDSYEDLVMQPDGRIMIAGINDDGVYNGNFFLSRFENDGLTDSSFGINGTIEYLQQAIAHNKSQAELSADGKLLLQGSSQNGIGVYNYNYILFRFLTDLVFTTSDFSTGNIVLPLVYPNPIDDQLTIQYELLEPEQVTITVYDLKGKAILSQASSVQGEGKHLHDVNVQSLNAGIYLLTLDVGGKRAVVKITKQ